MELKYEVVTTPFENGDIMQETNLLRDGLREQLTRTLIRTQDQQIKDALISLGWTPPGDKK